MSSIDERVVEMRFNNAQFEKGIKQTIGSIDDLRNSLKLEGIEDGLNSLAGSTDGISNDVSKVASKFNWFSVVGATALGALTVKALDVGKSMTAALVEPLIEGGKRRAQNIEQAKFQLAGLKVAWDDIRPAILHAVEGTAYGLDEAAKAASVLTASQVTLERMPVALRAISGVAAMTNSSYSDIADVFTKVAGQGRLMGDDLNRMAVRGLNAAAKLAEAMGITEAEVRKLVTEGQISFDMFADVMNNAFGDHAKKANETYAGSLANVRAALARIGEIPAAGNFEKLRIIFNALIPKIDEIKTALDPLLGLFARLSIKQGEGIAAFISSIDLSQLQRAFSYISLGIERIMNIIGKFAKAAKQAWAVAFPKSNEQSTWLIDLARGFNNLTKALDPSTATLNGFKNVLATIFGVVSVVVNILGNLWGVVKGVFGVVFQLVGLLWDLIAPIFKIQKTTGDATGDLGDFFEMLRKGIEIGVKPVIDFLTKLRDAIQNLREGGTSGNEFFDWLYNSLKAFAESTGDKIINFFTNLGNAMGALFGDGTMVQKIKTFFAAFGATGSDMKPMRSFGEWLKDFWNGIVDFANEVWTNIGPIAEEVGKWFAKIWDDIVDAFSKVEVIDVLAMAQAVAVLGVLIEFFKTMKSIRGLIDAAKETIQAIGGTFGQLTSTLKTVETGLKVNWVLKIAIAIGLLAAAVWLLAQVPIDKLWNATGALVVLSVVLLAFFKGFTMIADSVKEEDIAKITAMSWSLLAISGAIALLSLAVAKLAELDYGKMWSSVGAVILMLAALAGAAWLMGKSGPVLMKTAISMGVFAGALWILALAIERFAGIDAEKLEKGGWLVAGAMAAMAGAAFILGKAGSAALPAAAGIALLVASMFLIAMAIERFASIDSATIETGGNRIAVAIMGMVAAAILLSNFGGNSWKGALAIIGISAALFIVAEALEKMAALPMEQMQASVIALTLLMLALGFTAAMLDDQWKGALGVIGIALALSILAVSLAQLASVPTEGLIAATIALGSLALVMGGIVAVLSLFPVTFPILLAFAAVLAGVALIAFGIAAVITALTNAFVMFVTHADAAAQAIITISMAAAAVVDYVPALILVAIGLGAFGIAAGLAAIGTGLLGAALVLLGIGLALIAVLGPIGAIALQGIIERIGGLTEHVPGLVGMGSALGILGVGLIVLGVGLLFVAGGAALFNLAMMGFMTASMQAAIGLSILSAAADKNVGSVGPLLALSVGLAAFGVAAGAAGIGAIILGAGLTLMGAGLLLVKRAGESSAETLVAIGGKLTELAIHAIPLGIVAGVLAALGAGAVLLGAGAIIASAGLFAMTAALLIFTAMAPAMTSNLQTAADQLPSIVQQIADAFATLATSIAANTSSVGAAVVGISVVIITGLSGIATAAIAAGKGIANGLASGVQAGTAAVIGAMTILLLSLSVTILATTATMIVAGLTFTVSLASGITAGVGAVLVAGALLGASVALGALTALGNAVSAGRTLATGIATGLSTNASAIYAGAYAIGSQMINGMVNGISAGIGRVINMARNMANSAINAAKNTLGIASPSKVFATMGEQTDDGFAVGQLRNIGVVADAGERVGLAAIDAVSDVLKRANDLIPVDMDMSPTIRPVLDLSDVERDAATIGALLTPPRVDVGTNYTEAVQAAAEFNQNRSDSFASASSFDEPRVVNLNFEQKNESPKALPASELYRNTNNMLSKTKKELTNVE